MLQEKDAFELHLQQLKKGVEQELNRQNKPREILEQFCAELVKEECTVKDLFFKIQQAHWNYEDNFRQQLCLPKMKFKVFAKEIFTIGFRERLVEFEKQYEEFIEYINKRPRCGAILMSSDMAQCLLVKGNKVKKWQFPGGKMETTDKNAFQCALRELKEELNVSITCTQPLRKIVRRINAIKRTYFVVLPNGIPTIQNKKEVKEARWFSIQELNDNSKQKEFQLVTPFISELLNFSESHQKGCMSDLTYKQQPAPTRKHFPRQNHFFKTTTKYHHRHHHYTNQTPSL